MAAAALITASARGSFRSKRLMAQLRHSWPALTAAHPARPRRSAHLGPAVNTPTSPGRGLLPISMVLALRRQLTAWSGSAPIGEVAGTAQRSPAPDPFPP